jgi:hypothetical protein
MSAENPITQSCLLYKEAALASANAMQATITSLNNQATAAAASAQAALTWWQAQSPTASCTLAYQALLDTLQGLANEANALGQRIFALIRFLEGLNCSSPTWANDVASAEADRLAIAADRDSISQRLTVAIDTAADLVGQCTPPIPVTPVEE